MSGSKNKDKSINERISSLLKKLSKSDMKNNQEVIELLKDIEKNNSNQNGEIRYSRLFDHMQDAIIVYEAIENGNNFTIVNFNAVAEKQSKIKREKIIGKNVTEVFPEVFEVGLLSVFKEVWKTGISQKYPVSIFDGEMIVRWKENFIFKLPSGEVVSTYRDITKEKQIEKKVELSEINLKSLINTRKESIWSIDAEYNYIILNDLYKEQYFLSYTIELEVGNNAIELLTDELYHFWKKKYDRALSGEKYSFEFSADFRDSTYHYEVSLNPIVSNKIVTGVSAISTDITERKLAEEAIKISEENYKGIFNSTSDAIYIQDKNGVFIDVNAGVEKMYGYPRELFIGNTPAFISAPDKNDINAIMKAVTNAYNGKEEKFEYWGLRKNGVAFPKDVRLSPGKYNGKKVVIAVAQDISERKKAERALQKSEERYKNIILNLKQAYYEVDRRGVITHISQEFKIITGFSDKEIIGKISFLFVHEDFRNKIIAEYKECKTNQKSSHTCEFKANKKNGIIVWVEQFTNFQYDGKGKIIKSTNIVKDITERKEAEEALRESEINFRLLFENSPLGTYIADSKGNVIDSNSEFLQMLGSPSIEATKKINVLTFPPLVKNGYSKLFSECVKNNETLSLDIEYTSKWGTDNTYSCFIIPLSNRKGEVEKVYTIMEDITKQKNAERALRESEAIFRNLSESTATAIFVYQDEKFVFVNKSTEELTGFSTDELLGMKIWDVVHPDSKELISERGFARQKGDVVESRYQFRLVKKDGSDAWIDFTAGKISWEGKKAAIGSAIDITEQKKTEKELKRNEEKYRVILNSASDYLFTANVLENGNCKMDWVGGSFEKITGYTLEEYIENGSWAAALHPEDVHLDEVASEELRQNRRIEIEVRIINKNGDIVWIRESTSPVWSEKEQRVVSIYGAVKDITEEKNIELALKESEARYKLITNLTSDYIFSTVIDKNGKSIPYWVGGSFEEITGYTFEEYNEVGGWIGALHPDDLERDREAYKKIENNEKVKIEVRTFHKSGKIVWIESFGSPVWDCKNNKLVGINGACTDITKEKLASIALEENEEKYRILSLVTSDYVYEIKITDDGVIDIVWVGGSFEEITGYTFDEYKKHGGLRKVIHPDDIKIYDNGYKESLANRTFSTEVRTYHKNGNIIWVKAFGYPMWDYSKNKLIGILGSVKDITKEKEALFAVQESGEKYKLISNITSDYLFESRFNDKNILETIWVAGSFKKMTGYKLEEYRKLGGWSALLHEGDIEIDNAAFNKLSKNKEVTLEVRTHHKDGNIIWIRNACSPIWDKSNNKLIGIIGSAKDITEEKQNQIVHEIQYNIAEAIVNSPNTNELFKKVRTELNKILNSTNFYIAFFDEKRRMLKANIGKDEKDSIDTWSVENSISGVVINSKKRLLINKEEIIELANSGEIDIIGTIPEVWLGVPLKVRAKVVGIMAVQNYDDRNAYDKISVGLFEVIGNQLSLYLERNRAQEDALRLSRAIIQSPVSVVITNLEGEVEYVNPKFEKISGYTFEDVVGENPRILKSGTMSAEFYKNLWKTILAGKDWHGEFLNKKRNGDLYWENAVISPIENESGKITHFVAIKEDITEKKKMLEELISSKEKAELSEKIKTEFLAQMSHEIRSPLNVILSFVGLLKEDLAEVATEDMMNSFESIDSASTRITRTIDLILNMTDLQLGSYESSLEEINIIESLNKVQKEYHQYATRKGLDLRLNINFNRKKIISDKYALIQIISNLVDNAIKYSDKGYIEIFAENNENSDLVIKVIDTGIGMSKEFLPNIFNSFSQEEQGYTRSYDGNGLGMALVKKYCDIIYSNISVKSKKGKGTTFTLIIPNLKNKLYIINMKNI